jgi:flagellar basal-body rod protein FlgC
MAISALNAGLSGMNANQRALDIEANNVANVDTANFQPQRAALQEAAPAGSGVTLSAAGRSLAAASGANGTSGTSSTSSTSATPASAGASGSPASSSSSASLSPSAPLTASASSPASGVSGTDLADATVNSLVYKAGFDLSAKVVQTADQRLGTLINIQA